MFLPWFKRLYFALAQERISLSVRIKDIERAFKGFKEQFLLKIQDTVKWEILLVFLLSLLGDGFHYTMCLLSLETFLFATLVYLLIRESNSCIGHEVHLLRDSTGETRNIKLTYCPKEVIYTGFPSRCWEWMVV